MKALITGANGHIGANLALAALAAGVTPVAFVRARSDRRLPTRLDVEVCEGDLLDAPSLVRAMQGVQVLFHVGAVHRNFDVDPARIERPAVEGTLNALAAARRQGVERIVYTSTAATKVRAKLGERAAPDPGWA